MRKLAIAVAAMCVACTLLSLAQQNANPITNGSFETLGPDGWAVDWEQVGREVAITHDARTGQNAVLLRRTQDAIDKKLETGLNRAWKAHSGEQGKMLSQRKGGVVFWYKVPRAPKSAHLRFYMIPMTADPIEGTGGGRQWFEVPPEHFGDGKWHQGMVAYDFTDLEKCKWVQVSPRIISDEPAEWIIDDVEWVESIGPLAQVASLRLMEVPGREGRECTVSATIKNTGDAPLAGTAELILPQYLHADQATRPLGPVPPRETTTLKWQVTGTRDREDVIQVRVHGGTMDASGTLPLSAQIEDAWAQVDQFVLWPGRETTVRFIIRNAGTAALRNVKFSVSLPPQLEPVGPTSATLDAALPGVSAATELRIRARGPQTSSARLRCSWQTPDGQSGTQEISIVIAAQPPAAPDQAPADAARLGCSSFEIVFPRNDFGYGVGWIYAGADRSLVGAIPWLARVVLRGQGQDNQEFMLYAQSFEREARVSPLGLPRGDGTVAGALAFSVDREEMRRLGLRGPVTIAFAAGKADGHLGRIITWQVACPAPQQPVLAALEGPTLCFGEGAFADDKDEALYPGLEWLVRGEVSSSTLDIAADHPHRVRYVVHPHMVTIPLMAVRRGHVTAGVLWHSRSAWNDGENRPNIDPDRSDVDRASSIFASPDRFRGHASHCMGLMVPTVPEYVPANATAAEKPWPAEGVSARSVRLLGGIYVNDSSSTVMDAMRAWFDVYGVVAPRSLPHTDKPFTEPQPPPAVPFRGYRIPRWLEAAARTGQWSEPTREQWIDEVEWSTQAYLKTLWDDDRKAWLSFKGGPAISLSVGPHAPFLYDCVVASMLTDDPGLREQLRQRINLVGRLYPGVVPQADDLGFNFGQPVNALIDLDRNAVGTAKTQDPDGGWRFHPYIATGGVFKGMDYAELGYEGQEAVGLVARKAYILLKAARTTGDEQML
ncbi:MAG: hypothetical protein H5T86_02270 [Armatimonadetes bacterium]|nr:hypothetical protein [Armatimonadota bacterium]